MTSETERRLAEKKLPYPDRDSQMMALYGSSYTEVTLRTAHIDEIMKILTASKEEIEDGLDPALVLSIFKTPELIRPSAKLPPEVDEVTESTIVLLRKLIIIRKSLVLLGEIRDSVVRYGRVVGAAEYAEEWRKRGISEKNWQNAALYFGQKHPIGGRP